MKKLMNCYAYGEYSLALLLDTKQIDCAQVYCNAILNIDKNSIRKMLNIPNSSTLIITDEAPLNTFNIDNIILTKEGLSDGNWNINNEVQLINQFTDETRVKIYLLKQKYPKLKLSNAIYSDKRYQKIKTLIQIDPIIKLFYENYL